MEFSRFVLLAFELCNVSSWFNLGENEIQLQYILEKSVFQHSNLLQFRENKICMEQVITTRLSDED